MALTKLLICIWLVITLVAHTASAEEQPICDGDKVWEPDVQAYITCEDCRSAGGYTNCHLCACTKTEAPVPGGNGGKSGPKDGNYWENRGTNVPFEYGFYMVIGAVFLLMLAALVCCLLYVRFLRKKVKKLEALPEKQTQVSDV